MHCPDCGKEMNETDVYTETKDRFEVEVVCLACGTKFFGRLFRTASSRNAEKSE